MKDETEVEMTLKKNGRWYRFVQVDDIVFHCSKCCFLYKCFGRCRCPVGLYTCGYFERFRPTSELVRIGVRLLKRLALKYFPYSAFVCHGPQSRHDSDNEISFYVYGECMDDMPAEIQAVIDRLNELGITVY